MLAPSVVSHATNLVKHPALSPTHPPLRGARRPREPLLENCFAAGSTPTLSGSSCALVKGAASRRQSLWLQPNTLAALTEFRLSCRARLLVGETCRLIPFWHLAESPSF